MHNLKCNARTVVFWLVVVITGIAIGAFGCAVWIESSPNSLSSVYKTGVRLHSVLAIAGLMEAVVLFCIHNYYPGRTTVKERAYLAIAALYSGYFVASFISVASDSSQLSRLNVYTQLRCIYLWAPITVLNWILLGRDKGETKNEDRSTID